MAERALERQRDGWAIGAEDELSRADALERRAQRGSPVGDGVQVKARYVGRRRLAAARLAPGTSGRVVAQLVAEVEPVGDRADRATGVRAEEPDPEDAARRRP